MNQVIELDHSFIFPFFRKSVCRIYMYILHIIHLANLLPRRTLPLRSALDSLNFGFLQFLHQLWLTNFVHTIVQNNKHAFAENEGISIIECSLADCLFHFLRQ